MPWQPKYILVITRTDLKTVKFARDERMETKEEVDKLQDLFHLDCTNENNLNARQIVDFFEQYIQQPKKITPNKYFKMFS